MKNIIVLLTTGVIIATPIVASALIPLENQKSIELNAKFGSFFRSSGFSTFEGESYFLRTEPWMYLGLDASVHYAQKGLLSFSSLIPLRNFNSPKGNVLNIGFDLLQEFYKGAYIRASLNLKQFTGTLVSPNSTEEKAFFEFNGKISIPIEFKENFFLGIGFQMKRHHTPLVFSNISGTKDAPVVYSDLISESVVYAYQIGIETEYSAMKNRFFYQIKAEGNLGPGLADEYTKSLNRGLLLSVEASASGQIGLQVFKSYPYRALITLGLDVELEHLRSTDGGDIIENNKGDVVDVKHGHDLAWTNILFVVNCGINFSF